jgi:hypothetical protein
MLISLIGGAEMDCTHNVFLQKGEGLRLVMKTDLCLEELLDAVKGSYPEQVLVITDQSGEILFRTR